jgi:hypothetical protein
VCAHRADALAALTRVGLDRSRAYTEEVVSTGLITTVEAVMAMIERLMRDKLSELFQRVVRAAPGY